VADQDPYLVPHPVLDEVRQTLPDPARVWLVGGAVRDALLRRRLKDFDFALDGNGLAAARAVADRLQAAYYPLDAERGTGRVIADFGGERLTLDFAHLRGADLPADLAGRDFTVNAMATALDRPNEVIDPLGGQRDLRTRRLRACSPTAMSDDPVRCVRAVRLAAELNLTITPDTRDLLRESAASLGRVSAERRRDEFVRCLAGPRPAGALRALDALGLLIHLAPELTALKGVTQSPPHVFDVWNHTLVVIDRLRDVLAALGPVHDVDAASDLALGLVSLRLGRHRSALDRHLQQVLPGGRPALWLLMLAAAFHDISKPETRTVDDDGRIRFFNHDRVGAEVTTRRLRELRFSTEETSRASTIVAHHLRPLLLANQPPASRRAIYRFFRDTGEAGVDVILLSLADFLGTYADGPPPVEEWNRLLDVCVSMLQAWFEQPEQMVSPPSLITGHDLMESFGLEAGPRVGRLLEELREAQAMGDVVDRESALAFVRKRLER
jgi:tRNA nucleotidyltransferase/poly(A) polymerase